MNLIKKLVGTPKQRVMTPGVVERLLLEKACLIDLIVSLLKWVIVVLVDLLFLHFLEHGHVLCDDPIDGILAHLLERCHLLKPLLVELLEVGDHGLPLGLHLHAYWLGFAVVGQVGSARPLSMHLGVVAGSSGREGFLSVQL